MNELNLNMSELNQQLEMLSSMKQVRCFSYWLSISLPQLLHICTVVEKERNLIEKQQYGKAAVGRSIQPHTSTT